MKLWTIQSMTAWKVLQKSKLLRCDPLFAEELFAEGYAWMVKQMTNRLPVQPYAKGALPLWAWYQWDGAQRKKPDLRCGYHRPSGTRAVRIEFEMDDNLVLLSDFELWHYVLNYDYLRISLDDEAFDAKLEEQGLSYVTRRSGNRVVHKMIGTSWDRIFALDWVEEDLARPRAEKSIQAVFWELPLENVRRVHEFVAR